VAYRWTKGARSNAPAESGPQSKARKRTERLKRQAFERHFIRHEGLAPVRLAKGSKTGSGPFQAVAFRRIVSTVGLSFPGPRGDSDEDKVRLLRAIRLAALTSDKRRRKASAIRKRAPALHLLSEVGGTGNEDCSDETARNELRTTAAR
jgi:hypothetical protein